MLKLPLKAHPLQASPQTRNPHELPRLDNFVGLTFLGAAAAATEFAVCIPFLDSVIPETAEPHFGKLVDLEMLLMPGGRERTETEFRTLFAKAGFEITHIAPTRGAESVIEARLR